MGCPSPGCSAGVRGGGPEGEEAAAARGAGAGRCCLGGSKSNIRQGRYFPCSAHAQFKRPQCSSKRASGLLFNAYCERKESHSYPPSQGPAIRGKAGFPARGHGPREGRCRAQCPWPAPPRSLASGSPRASARAQVAGEGVPGPFPQVPEPARKSHWLCVAVQGGRGTPHPSVPWSRPVPPTGCMQGPVLPGSPASGACLPAAPQVPGPTGQGLATMESCAPALGSCPPRRGRGGTCTGPAQEEKVIHATFSNQHAGFWQAPAPTRLPKPPRAVFLWPAPNTLLRPPAVSVSAALGRHGAPLQGQVNNCCCFGTRRSQ